jgi:hypothetical protein
MVSVKPLSSGTARTAWYWRTSSTRQPSTATMMSPLRMPAAVALAEPLSTWTPRVGFSAAGGVFTRSSGKTFSRAICQRRS